MCGDEVKVVIKAELISALPLVLHAAESLVALQRLRTSAAQPAATGDLAIAPAGNTTGPAGLDYPFAIYMEIQATLPERQFDVNWLTVFPPKYDNFQGRAVSVDLYSTYYLRDWLPAAVEAARAAAGLPASSGGGGGGEAAAAQAPATWEELLALAAAVEGRDLDGDGQADHGLCLDTHRACKVWGLLSAVYASMAQTAGQQQGVWFDRATMRPLVHNPAMRAALDMWRRLEGSSWPPRTAAPILHEVGSGYGFRITPEDCPLINPHFASGKCLFTLDWAHTLPFINTWQAPKLAGRLGMALAPGSPRVWVQPATQHLTASAKPAPVPLYIQAPLEGYPSKDRTFADVVASIAAAEGSSGGATVGPQDSTSGPDGLQWCVGGSTCAAPFAEPLEPSSLAAALLGQAGATAGTWANRAPLTSVPSSFMLSGDPMEVTGKQSNVVYAWMGEVYKIVTMYSMLYETYFASTLNASLVVDWSFFGFHPDDAAQLPAFLAAGDQHPNQAVELRTLHTTGYRIALDEVAFAATTHEGEFTPSAAAPLLSDLFNKFVFVMGGIYWRTLNYKAPPIPVYNSTADTATQSDGWGLSHSAVVAVIAVPIAALLLIIAVVGAVVYRYRSRRSLLSGRVLPPKWGPDVTLVATDIQNSTLLWELLPTEVMNACLSVHHGEVRKALEAHGGHEVSTEGDAFLASFHTPWAALAFSLDLQARLLNADWPPLLLATCDGAEAWAEPNAAVLESMASTCSGTGGGLSRVSTVTSGRGPNWHAGSLHASFAKPAGRNLSGQPPSSEEPSSLAAMFSKSARSLLRHASIQSITSFRHPSPRSLPVPTSISGGAGTGVTILVSNPLGSLPPAATVRHSSVTAVSARAAAESVAHKALGPDGTGSPRLPSSFTGGSPRFLHRPASPRAGPGASWLLVGPASGRGAPPPEALTTGSNDGRSQGPGRPASGQVPSGAGTGDATPDPPAVHASTDSSNAAGMATATTPPGGSTATNRGTRRANQPGVPSPMSGGPNSAGPNSTAGPNSGPPDPSGIPAFSLFAAAAASVGGPDSNLGATDYLWRHADAAEVEESRAGTGTGLGVLPETAMSLADRYDDSEHLPMPRPSRSTAVGWNGRAPIIHAATALASGATASRPETAGTLDIPRSHSADEGSGQLLPLQLAPAPSLPALESRPPSCLPATQEQEPNGVIALTCPGSPNGAVRYHSALTLRASSNTGQPTGRDTRSGQGHSSASGGVAEDANGGTLEEVLNRLLAAASTGRVHAGNLGVALQRLWAPTEAPMDKSLREHHLCNTALLLSGDAAAIRPLLAQRGLRVRIGVHSGVPQDEVVETVRDTRYEYRGACMARTKATCDLAAGGAVLLTETTQAACNAYKTKMRQFSLIQVGLPLEPPVAAPEPLIRAATLAKRIVERPVVPHHSALRVASTGVQPEGGDSGPDLFCALDVRLMPRCGLPAFFRHGYTPDPCSSSLLAPLGDIVAVFIYVSGVKALRQWHAGVLAEAVALLQRDVQAAAAEAGGYVVAQAEGSAVVVFAQPTTAVAWAVGCQERALQLPWPQALLEHEAGAEARRDGRVVLRGLRLRVGLEGGPAIARVVPRTGRLDYTGRTLNRASRIASKAGQGAVLTSAALWSRVRAAIYGTSDGGAPAVVSPTAAPGAARTSREGVPPPPFLPDVRELVGNSQGHVLLKGVKELVELVQVEREREPGGASPE
ncbi:hypothetical protein HYH03_010920 [Edaphochlamys debaryana]|uniref:Guanylate cyclase domain-containing protein n=1 Tax=Edaphochlamys debaryana TaxID=47281 RepID=A0A835XVW0_9CHLO|nr:hypothetical protein HYH03_010920 [Edaphochlamys debaryana]|eukprot:KAG2490770.1 hypothetical protein HYH03_010920 [Edaphochlamys debaryana]